MASKNYTATTFAEALLKRLGAPASNENIQALVAWEAAEGGNWENTARFNPLNTTEPMPGYSKTGTQGDIGSYTSWEQGLEATVKTLQNGDYGSVIEALRNGNNADAVANAVVSSPWGTKTIHVGADYTAYGQSGGTSGAGQVPAGSGLGAAKGETVGQLLDDDPDIESTYGYLAAYIKNPEIGPILAKAAKNGWGPNELLGALEKTKFWQTTAASARTWQATKTLDPATARQQLGQERLKIQQLAESTLGNQMAPDRLNQMANAALAGGWNDEQLQNAIGAEFKYQGATAKYKGAAGQTIDGLQQLSQSYLVPISGHTMGQWTRQILEGASTTQDFQSYLQAQAESLFPTLTSALKSGQTVQQYMDPYAQMASQILEKPTGAFNFMNPKWAKALNTVQPDGTRAPMTLGAWGDYLRSLPDYKGTQQAQQQAAQFGESLLNTFGKVSNGAGDSGLNVTGAVASG